MRPTVLALSLSVAAAAASAESFSVTSADGVAVQGQIDRPIADAGPVVAVLVAGTGLFDRDVRFGRSGTPRDLLFADLSARLTERGATVLRYDRRGVVHGATGPAALDKTVAGTSSVVTQRDDLAAVYALARQTAGPQGCVVLFGHSEGAAHVARLAESGAPRPAAVFGVGAAMDSPAAIVRWQVSGRDLESLRLMDADQDGRVTNAEVEAGWRRTPSSFADTAAPFVQPDGAWSESDMRQVAAVQSGVYEQLKAAALAQADDAPYPNATTPMATYGWWKSWFLDDVPSRAGSHHGATSRWSSTTGRSTPKPRQT